MRQLIAALLFFSTSLQAQSGNQLLNTFKKYITGDFDNSAQVIAEISSGKQMHPLAIHVNRIADAKIINKPANLKGFFVLEESYYLLEGKSIDVKPYLFLFEEGYNNTIQLTTYQLPLQLEKSSIRNDNPELQFDFQQLKPSPTFKGAVYTWDNRKKTFHTNTPQDLPNGLRFTLIETFTANTLSVMELVEKDGKRLTAWDSPILYKRKL
jgi:hypothetical protein